MDNPYFSLFSKSWKYAESKRPRYILIYSLFIVHSLMVAANPLLFGWLVNSLQEGGDDTLHNAWLYTGVFLALQFGSSAIQGPTRVMERRLAFDICQNMMFDYFHKILHLPIKWHKENHSGVTINRLKKAFGAMNGFFQSGFFHLFTFSQFFLSLIGMLFFSFKAGIVAVFLGMLMIWVMLKFDKPFIRTQKELNEEEHSLASNLTDAITNIFTVIILRLEQSMKLDLRGKFENMLVPFRKNIIINEWKWFTANVLVWMIYLVMVLGYIYDNFTPGETFMVGGLVALLGYVNQFTSSFSQMAQTYTQAVTNNTDVQAVETIDHAYAKQYGNSKKVSPPENWKHIDIKNLSFSYDDTHHVRENQTEITFNEKIPGVNQINFSFKRGDRIALVGESGSGKSTILSLLRGLYEPAAETEVSVDGVNSYSCNSLSQTVTLFPQEPETFENTILYNITLGLPFSMNEVTAACDTVCFSEVVEQLSEGFNSFLNENGVNLSVGQKQRLALARGVLASHRSSIILLDEPTSSVDTQTEKKIYERFFQMFTNKLVICSLHNLDLLPYFDYVYVIHKGRILEQGTVSELRNSRFLEQGS